MKSYDNLIILGESDLTDVAKAKLQDESFIQNMDERTYFKEESMTNELAKEADLIIYLRPDKGMMKILKDRHGSFEIEPNFAYLWVMPIVKTKEGNYAPVIPTRTN